MGATLNLYCALTTLHPQLQFLSVQPLREPRQQSINAALGSIHLLASTPPMLPAWGKVDGLIAAHTPNGKLPLPLQRAEQRA
jgi:hypothetical protein